MLCERQPTPTKGYPSNYSRPAVKIQVVRWGHSGVAAPPRGHLPEAARKLTTWQIVLGLCLLSPGWQAWRDKHLPASRQVSSPKSGRYLGKVPRLAVHEKQLAQGNSGIQMAMGTSQLCIFDDVPPGGARSFALHRLAPCREAASGKGEVRESDALA